MPELGMSYYKARMYSPTLGRFLQIDPIGYKDQINLYSYVGNDPAQGIDPTGNDTLIIYGGPVGYNIFGHIELATTGTGIHSYGTSESVGSNVTDYVNRQVAIRDVVIVRIPTTAAQERRIINAWTEIKDKPYSVYYNNCATAVSAGLDAGGLPPNTSGSQSSSDGSDALAGYISGNTPDGVLNRATQQQGAQVTRVGRGRANAGAAFRPFTLPQTYLLPLAAPLGVRPTTIEEVLPSRGFELRVRSIQNYEAD